jgi:hypothetical protein
MSSIRAPPSLNADLFDHHVSLSRSERKNSHMFYKKLFDFMRQASPLRLVLLNMGLLDELLTGFLVIGLPLERATLRLTYEQIGLLLRVE